MAVIQIPVTVIAGYLGVGKTTVLNGLLRSSRNRRLAVMVNDFGSINIDAELIADGDDTNGGIVELANGCICCSLGDDLGFALLDLMDRQPPPDHIVIEASGIAEPARVRGFLSLLPNLQVEATIVLAEAGHIKRQAGDQQIGPLIDKQLRAADLLLISKADLVSTEELEKSRLWLNNSYPAAGLLDSIQGNLPAEILLGLRNDISVAPQNDHDHDHYPETNFFTFVFKSKQHFDRDKLAEQFNIGMPGVIRCKGFIQLKDNSKTMEILQLVGSRWSFEQPNKVIQPRENRLIFIGLMGAIDENAIVARLETAYCSETDD